MITIEYIESTTKAITSPRKSVELAKSGQLYVPTVRRVVKELSDTDMERLIMTYLVRLNVVLNLARPMNDVMIKTTAGLAVQHILSDDCDVTLADIRIIFERAMKGQYGQFYNGIGSADVIRWIDIYIGEKCEEYERWHQNEYRVPDQFERSSTNEKENEKSFREVWAKYESTRKQQSKQQSKQP